MHPIAEEARAVLLALAKKWRRSQKGRPPSEREMHRLKVRAGRARAALQDHNAQVKAIRASQPRKGSLDPADLNYQLQAGFVRWKAEETD